MDRLRADGGAKKVCMCEYVRVCVCVCVCERERERAKPHKIQNNGPT